MIKSHAEWLVEYRKDKTATWVIVKTSCGQSFYFKEYEDWYTIQDILESNNMIVSQVDLRYRSNNISQTLEDCDGVYIIRSLFGTPGKKSVHTMTVGKIKGDKVEKTVWLLQGLVEDSKYVDLLENCFVEAMYLWKKSN